MISSDQNTIKLTIRDYYAGRTQQAEDLSGSACCYAAADHSISEATTTLKTCAGSPTTLKSATWAAATRFA